MKRGKRFFATLVAVPLFFCGLGAVTSALATSSSPIVIAEIQTGSSVSASQEFIELQNISSRAVDVSNWRVEYVSATAKNLDTPSRIIPLHGILPPMSHYLLASSGYLVGSANDTFSAGLAATGGHVRLVAFDPSATDTLITYDTVGWGTSLHPETDAATAPKAGESLQRLANSDGTLIDTDNNADDFALASPSPEGYVPEATVPDQNDTNTGSDPVSPDNPNPDDQTVATDSSTDVTPPVDVPVLPPLPLEITELLPNPASPQTDAADEFIEIYNPNTTKVELTGYKLQTGTTYSHSFEFNDQTIGAQSYKAFYVPETSVVLANTAGKARLIDPTGRVMSETADYEDAPEGQAWVWDNGVWSWSTTVTPGAANVSTQKQDEPKTTKSAAKSTTTKASSTAKPKTGTTAKKASAKAVKGAANTAGGAGSTQASSQEPAKASALHPAILAGVGSLALLYGVYEYRHDFANAVHRIRDNRTNRRTNRTKS